MERLRFNFIMSIGRACRPAGYLQQYGLRTLASPLDWQMTDSLPAILHLVRTSFCDFFTEIEEIEKYANAHCRFVVDKKNDVASMHHFPISTDLLSGQAQFQEQMLRRWKKTDCALKKAKRIGLLCNRKEPLSELESFLIEFAKLYPNKKITMINVRNADTDEIEKTEKLINPNLRILEYQFHDEHPKGNKRDINPDFWLGNPEKWAVVVKQIRVINPKHFLKPCRYFLSTQKPKTGNTECNL